MVGQRQHLGNGCTGEFGKIDGGRLLVRAILRPSQVQQLAGELASPPHAPFKFVDTRGQLRPRCLAQIADLELQRRKRRSEFMRGVRHKPLLGRKRGFKTAEQFVRGGHQ